MKYFKQNDVLLGVQGKKKKKTETRNGGLWNQDNEDKA